MRTAWTEGRDYSIVCHTIWKITCRNQKRKAESLKFHPDYYEAKKLGSYEAAQSVADSLIRPEALEMLRDIIKPERFDMDPKAKRPVLIAPSLVSGSNNVIPIWTAYNIGFQLGLGVDRDIFQKEKIGRTGTGAMFRLLNQPEFYGPVSIGREYIIVDDNYTRGGTISSLRSYIESNGGKVLCATVLADQDRTNKHAANPLDKLRGHMLRWNISDETRQGIEAKHGGWRFEEEFRDRVGFGTGCLTESEGKFIQHFSDRRALFRAIDEEKNLSGTRSSRELFESIAPQTPFVS